MVLVRIIEIKPLLSHFFNSLCFKNYYVVILQYYQILSLFYNLCYIAVLPNVEPVLYFVVYCRSTWC